MANGKRPGEEEFSFAPLAREEVKFKGLLVGSSGAGKSVSAALMAYGLCGDWSRVAIVDTEHERAKQIGGQVYSGVRVPQRGDPKAPLHCSFGPPYSPERFCALMESVAERDLCDVLDLDGLTPFWAKSGGVLEIVDSMGGWIAAGKHVTPRFNRLIDAVCGAPMHVVATLRAKMQYEYAAETTAEGKQKVKDVKRVGLGPIFRPDTIEYEATTVWMVNGDDHTAVATKDNTNLFDGLLPERITPETGRQVAAWCDGAVSRVGSSEWVALKAGELSGYAGTTDGLLAMWASVFSAKSKIEAADFARLAAAKDAGKVRVEAASAGRVK